MKKRPGIPKQTRSANAASVHTTIMELLQMISGLTKDDTAVLSVFKAIFDSHKVRLAHSMVPIQLVTGQKAHRIY